MKTLKEIIGIEQDGGEAEVEEEVGDPQYALAGEEDGVEAVDFGPPGGAGPAPRGSWTWARAGRRRS